MDSERVLLHDVTELLGGRRQTPGDGHRQPLRDARLVRHRVSRQRARVLRLDPASHASLVRLLLGGAGARRLHLSRASAGLRARRLVGLPAAGDAGRVRDVSGRLPHVAVPQSDPRSRIHRRTLHLHLPPVQARQVLHGVARRQGDRCADGVDDAAERHPRLLLDVRRRRARLQHPQDGDDGRHAIAVGRLVVDHRAARLRAGAARHPSPQRARPQRGAQDLALRGEAALPGEGPQDVERLGVHRHAPRRLLLPHRHGAARHRLLQHLLLLPRRRRATRRGAARHRRPVAASLPLLARADDNTGDRHVALRVQRLHLSADGHRVPARAAAPLRASPQEGKELGHLLDHVHLARRGHVRATQEHASER